MCIASPPISSEKYPLTAKYFDRTYLLARMTRKQMMRLRFSRKKLAALSPYVGEYVPTKEEKG
jgi:hypothetical protein